MFRGLQPVFEVALKIRASANVSPDELTPLAEAGIGNMM